MPKLSSQLQSLVDQAATLLGEVIRAEAGASAYLQIEKLRKEMARLRQLGDKPSFQILRRELIRLDALGTEGRMRCARAFTLMLEVMNACENAYRSFSIHKNELQSPEGKPDSIIYVLTAHPTEARSPQNIWVFHALQICLSECLIREKGELRGARREEARHLLMLAWKTSIVRARKPKVHDEAEHIFSTLLREETLRPLLRASVSIAPVFIRTWVGGDKDGHPGVNEKTFLDSLHLSRRLILRFLEGRLGEAWRAAEVAGVHSELRKDHGRIKKEIISLRRVNSGDGKRILRLRETLRDFSALCSRAVGAAHPALQEIQNLVRMFPALVVPLEFRESSDQLPGAKKNLQAPICRMLAALARVAEGGDPRWYVRGFIVSMTESINHIRLAAFLARRALGQLRIPVIPLFEQAEALDQSPVIVRQMLKDRLLAASRKKYWQGYLEVMVGYSDSSKQSGVLPSRLKIAENMHRLDRLCRSAGVTPLFFQGSGGSVDRGGGSIGEQTAWWPSGALKNYKVTIQGEMVERSMASPEITWRQLQRIAASAGRWRNAKSYTPAPAAKRFSQRVASAYQTQVSDPAFLHLIAAATPYLFLDRLHIGSRPTKRASGLLNVGSLRAIPWVLCWTQTRVLFPTWWGVGSAWKESSAAEKRQLRLAYHKDPVFTVFVRALSYTVAKIEMPIWRLYLESSSLSAGEKAAAIQDFSRELAAVKNLLLALRPKKENEREWLYESIRLRSPMIHPLNLLQLLALKHNEPELLRITVTGIANGMVATG